jgi:hypothetical protein
MKKTLGAFWMKHPHLFSGILALFFAFFACFLFSSSTSFLFPKINVDSLNLDSNFFYYLASLWLKGETPYLDFFDHKGLYHLAINALAILMGGRYALFALQVVFGSVALFALFESLALFAPKRHDLLFLAGLIYCGLYAMGSSGNTEGEWVLPYVSLAYYAYLRAIKTGKKGFFCLGSFFAGLEVGCALNSRPLDGIWGGALIVSFSVYILRQHWAKELFFNALYALLGLAIPYALILPFAFKGGYAEAMFVSIFEDSWAYISSPLEAQLTWFNRVLTLAVYGLGVALYFYERKKGDPLLGEFFFVSSSIAATLYFVFARYTTYYWSGYTFYILNLLYGVSLLPDFRKTKKHSWSLPLSGLWLALVLVWSTSLTTLYYTVGFQHFSYAETSAVEKAVLSIPEEKRHTKGAVYAIDCDAAVYTIGGIVTQNKYVVNQGEWSRFMPEVKEEMNRYFASSDHPEYVLLGERYDYTEGIYGDLVRTYYEPIAGTHELSAGAFTIYQRK